MKLMDKILEQKPQVINADEQNNTITFFRNCNIEVPKQSIKYSTENNSSYGSCTMTTTDVDKRNNFESIPHLQLIARVKKSVDPRTAAVPAGPRETRCSLPSSW